MAPGTGDKKAEKSYLASAVDSINPWAGSRSSIATTAKDPKDPKDAKDLKDLQDRQQSPLPSPITSADHITNPLYGKSFKTYPPDCPKPNVHWFHAADVSLAYCSLPLSRSPFLNTLAYDDVTDPEAKAQVPEGKASCRRRQEAATATEEICWLFAGRLQGHRSCIPNEVGRAGAGGARRQSKRVVVECASRPQATTARIWRRWSEHQPRG